VPFSLRPVTDDEFAEFERVDHAAFGFLSSDEIQAQNRSVVDLDRTIAVFDDARIVGVGASYAYELTLPGSSRVPVAGVSNIGVLPTDRRRGVLRSMMVHQLEDVAARGEVAAILNASEAAIYGRFGYGLASWYQTVRIDPAGATLRHPPAVAGAFRLLHKQDAAPVLTPLYEAYRLGRPGAVDRSEAWWDCVLGDIRTWKGGGPLFVAVFTPADGRPGGYVLYEITHDGGPGSWVMQVHELIAADPEVEAALWRYCFEVDLVGAVECTFCPVDDPIEWRLADPRRFHTAGMRDYLWVRLVDPAAALGARAYGGEGELIWEVTDALRPQMSGRYRLTATAGGATWEPITATADLSCDVDVLGSLWLGGVWPSALARAGRLVEHAPGAVAVADRLFPSSPAPFCVTRF